MLLLMCATSPTAVLTL